MVRTESWEGESSTSPSSGGGRDVEAVVVGELGSPDERKGGELLLCSASHASGEPRVSWDVGCRSLRATVPGCGGCGRGPGGGGRRRSWLACRRRRSRRWSVVRCVCREGGGDGAARVGAAGMQSVGRRGWRPRAGMRAETGASCQAIADQCVAGDREATSKLYGGPVLGAWTPDWARRPDCQHAMGMVSCRLRGRLGGGPGGVDGPLRGPLSRLRRSRLPSRSSVPVVFRGGRAARIFPCPRTNRWVSMGRFDAWGEWDGDGGHSDDTGGASGDGGGGDGGRWPAAGGRGGGTWSRSASGWQTAETKKVNSEGVDAWGNWNAKGKGRNTWKEGPVATASKSGKGKV